MVDVYGNKNAIYSMENNEFVSVNDSLLPSLQFNYTSNDFSYEVQFVLGFFLAFVWGAALGGLVHVTIQARIRQRTLPQTQAALFEAFEAQHPILKMGFQFPREHYRRHRRKMLRCLRRYYPDLRSYPEAQALEMSTMFGIMTFFYSVCRELKKPDKERDLSRLIVDVGYLAIILSKEPAVPADFLSHEVFKNVENMCREGVPTTQSFVVTEYMRKVVLVVACVVGFLIAQVTNSHFDYRQFLSSSASKFVFGGKDVNPTAMLYEVVTSLYSRVKYYQCTSDKQGFFADNFCNWELMSRVNDVLAHETDVRNGNYERIGCKSNADCMLMLSKLISDCKEASRSFETNSSIVRGTIKLQSLLSYVMSRMKGNSLREQPFAVMISGDSGMLKSVLGDIVAVQLLSKFGLPCGSEFVGRLNLEEEFQSTYEPHFTAVMLDDVANTKADKSEVMLTQKIIELINNAPSCTNQADIDKKGVIWYNPAVVVGTTNVPDLQAACYSNKPDSIMRRFVHVEVEGVVPARDPSKVCKNQWRGKVKVYDTRDKDGNFLPRIRAEFNTLASLLKVLCELGLDHVQVQKRVVEGSEKLFSTVPCEHNNIPDVCDLCDPDVPVDEDPFCKHDKTKGACVECVWETKDDGVTDHSSPKLCSHGKDIGCCVDCEINSMSEVPTTQSSVESGFSFGLTAFMIFYCMFQNFMYVYHPFLYRIGLVSFRRKTGLDFHWLSLKLRGIVMLAVLSLSGVWSINFLVCACLDMFGLSLVSFINRTQRRYAQSPWCTTSRHSLSTVAMALPVIAAAYMGFRYWSSSPSVTAHAGQFNDKENVWKTRKQDQFVNFDERQSHCFSDDIKPGVRSGVWSVRCGTVSSMVTHVHGGFWVINKHFVDSLKNGDVLRFARGRSTYGREVTKDIVYTEGMCAILGKSDLCLMKLHLDKGKSIRKLLPRTLEDVKCSTLPVQASIVCPERDDVRVMDMKYLEHQKLMHQNELRDATNLMRGNGVTVSGMCGLPYVVESSSGTMVIGFHSAGFGISECYASVLTQKMLDEATTEYCRQHTGVYVQSDNDGYHHHDPKSGEQIPIRVESPHWKSLSNNCPPPETNHYVGKVTGAPLTKMVSKIVKSLISDAFARVSGVPRAHGAPGGGSPMHDAKNFQRHYDGVNNISEGFQTEVLDTAADSLLSKLINSPSIADECYRLEVLDYDTVINGEPGRWGVDRMPMSTSGGFLSTGSKSQYFNYDEVNDRYYMTPALEKAVGEMEEIYASGSTCSPIFKTNLKDEPTKLTKEKVRVFSGAPLVYSLVVRKYLLTFASLFSFEGCRLDFESAVGTNCYSEDWLNLRNRITKFGFENIVAGDYASFDQNMYARVTERALGIVLSFVKYSNHYSDRDVRIVTGILTDLMYPTYCSQGDIFTVTGSNPSGNNLTTVINCLVNSLYVRAAYYTAAAKGNHPERFNDNVSLITYGDDNIMGVSHRVCDWFNHTTLADQFKQVGITYTMADKKTESVPLISLFDADFLKRKFTHDMVLGHCGDGSVTMIDVSFCPLDEMSLHKTLHCFRRGALDQFEDSRVAIKTVLAEAFQHGPEVYERYARHLGAVNEEHRLGVEIAPYQQQLEKWFENGWSHGEHFESIELAPRDEL